MEPAAQSADRASFDDGQFELDFSGLDLTTGATEELNFSEIDSDLATFAQDDVIRDALQRGVDLRIYSRQIDKDLRSMEMLSIKDYLNEADAIANLYEQITSCEAVLGQMQTMLQSFQDNLGGISNEIRNLQEQSLAMSIKMANRKALNAKFRSFLHRVAVSEQLIDRIVDGPIDEPWLRELKVLSDKIEFTTRHGERGAADGTAEESLSDLTVNPLETAAGREAVPHIQKLKERATARIREFLVRVIMDACKPRTNMSMMQYNLLLKYSSAMVFLQMHSAEVARELRSVYVQTVGSTLANIFKLYNKELTAALLPLPSKGDTIIEYSGSAHRSVGGTAGVRLDVSAPGVVKPVDPFTIVDRMGILDDVDAPALAAHVVQADHTRLTYEALFRSVHKHLFDVADAEESFDHKFFEHHGREVFGLVIAPTINVLLEALETYLATCYDAPGLLLLVALVAAFRQLMVRRKGDGLSSYFNRVTMLLWPRFKVVFDQNLLAVKAARENVSRLGRIDCIAHPITQRYAEFVSSIMVLHRSLASISMSDDSLPHHLTVLGREVDSLLLKMAGELSARPAKIAFMVNNYSLCLSVCTARKVDQADAAHFDAALKTHVDAYVATELDNSFRSLVSFVKDIEAKVVATAKAAGREIPLVGPDGAPIPPAIPADVPITANQGQVEGILREFNQNWRNGLKNISSNISHLFKDKHTALAMYKRVVSAFISYYERFQLLLQRAFPSSPALLGQLVALQTIYYEIKQGTRPFEASN